jgi:hypothetical protein
MRRRFTIVDAMVLVAATALGVACFQLWPEWYLSTAGRSVAATLKEAVGYWGPMIGATIALPWSVALLALRFRRPQPPLRLLVCQPGTVAAFAAAFGVPLILVDSKYAMGGAFMFAFTAAARVGPLVGFGWIVLALSGAWRSEPDWIDRTGRVVDIFWIAIYVWETMQLLWK